eukprot:4697484-Pyramimonas_sp.AAC.2
MADEVDQVKELVEEQSRMAIATVDHARELVQAASACNSEATDIAQLKMTVEQLTANLLTQAAMTHAEIQNMAKKMDKRQDLLTLQMSMTNACCGEFEYYSTQQQAHDVASNTYANMKERYKIPGNNCYMRSGYMVKQILMAFIRGATLETHSGGIYIQGYCLLPDQDPLKHRVDQDQNRELFQSRLKSQIHGITGITPRIEKTDKGKYVIYRSW